MGDRFFYSSLLLEEAPKGAGVQWTPRQVSTKLTDEVDDVYCSFFGAKK